MKQIFLTGANGFLGSHLHGTLISQGYSIVTGLREKSACRFPSMGSIHFEIGKKIENCELLKNCQVIIHCAWDQSETNNDRASQNLKSVENLLEIAKENKCHFILISSLAAHSQARSIYGKTKLHAEQIVEKFPQSTILRPGTILGQGGLYERLESTIKRVPIVPVFYGGRQKIQLIGISEVSSAIQRIIESQFYGSFNLAGFPGVEVKKLYEFMAQSFSLRRLYVPVPGDFALSLIQVGEKIGIRSPISSDNLLGLKYVQEVNTVGDWQKLWGDSVNMKSSIEYLISDGRT